MSEKVLLFPAEKGAKRASIFCKILALRFFVACCLNTLLFAYLNFAET